MSEKQYILCIYAGMKPEDENAFKLDTLFTMPVIKGRSVRREGTYIYYEGVFCGSKAMHNMLVKKYGPQTLTSISVSFSDADASDVLALLKVFAEQTREEYHLAPEEDEVTTLLTLIDDIEAMELGVPK